MTDDATVTCAHCDGTGRLRAPPKTRPLEPGQVVRIGHGKDIPPTLRWAMATVTRLASDGGVWVALDQEWRFRADQLIPVADEQAAGG